MNIKSLQVKITLWAGVCLIVTAGVIIAYFYHSMENMADSSVNSTGKIIASISELMQKKAMEAATDKVITQANAKVFQVQGKLDETMEIVQTLAYTLSGMKSKGVTADVGRDSVNSILRTVLENDKGIFAAYTIWEPDSFDMLDIAYTEAKGHDKTGRFIPYWYNGDDEKTQQIPCQDYENTEKYESGIRKGEFYLRAKESKKPIIIDPYLRTIGDKTVLVISLAAPIIVKDKFYGIAGIDLKPDFFQKLLEQSDADFFAGKGRFMLISNNKTVVAYSEQSDKLGRHIRTVFKNWEELSDYIHTEKEISMVKDDQLVVFATLKIKNTSGRWGVYIDVPQEVVLAETKAAYQKMMKNVEESDKNLRKQSRKAIMTQFALSTMFVLFGLFVMMLIAKNIVKPVHQVIEGLGEVFNKTSVASDNISASSRNLIERISKQASSVEEISSSLEQLSGMSEKNIENTNSTEGLSSEMAVANEFCNRLIQKMSESMQQMKQSSHAVQDIVSQIDAISFQTSLLSLNAAIEAARAGEYGAGFAVVADEVKRLAMRSAESAKNTNVLMDDIVRKISEAGNMVSQFIGAFEKLNNNNWKINELISDTISALRQQGSTINLIRDAMLTIDKAGQQNASDVEAYGHIAEEMNEQTEQLKVFVNELISVIGIKKS